jgi:hypothetical protein
MQRLKLVVQPVQHSHEIIEPMKKDVRDDSNQRPRSRIPIKKK